MKESLNYIWPKGKYLTRVGQVTNVLTLGLVMRWYIQNMSFPKGHELYEKHQKYLDRKRARRS